MSDTDDLIFSEPKDEGLGVLYRFHLWYGVELRKYPVVKRTPCGAWVRDVYGDTERLRFVLDVDRWARKRWAYPDLERARDSFIARTKKRVERLYDEIEVARSGLAEIDSAYRAAVDAEAVTPKEGKKS